MVWDTTQNNRKQQGIIFKFENLHKSVKKTNFLTIQDVSHNVEEIFKVESEMSRLSTSFITNNAAIQKSLHALSFGATPILGEH